MHLSTVLRKTKTVIILGIQYHLRQHPLYGCPPTSIFIHCCNHPSGGPKLLKEKLSKVRLVGLGLAGRVRVSKVRVS